ncbi:hypothetical protein LL037_18935 [Clostridium estertheticum]|uniref:hypothetical protein n=1 Tax=Clostridium estertheticum TaxID=238834 RepID=UPI001C0E4278|nr:hypothetical protein [Clostridium estertheticum]MBU3198541.1 hypothetical protein [Clostridium estertheticum]WAG64521.1 hypothetical protein LL037_18935 [Clostridium estertheticum]
MEKKNFKKLIFNLEKELLRLGYTKGTMTFYKSRWEMLLVFAQERGENYYSERLGIDFVEKRFNILKKILRESSPKPKFRISA